MLLSYRHFRSNAFFDTSTNHTSHPSNLILQPVDRKGSLLTAVGSKETTEITATMQSSSSFTLPVLLVLSVLFTASAFAPHTSCTSSHKLLQQNKSTPTPQTLQKARGFADDFDGIDDDDDEEDDRELVYARRSGRRGREEGAYYDADTSSSGSRKYQDNVEFFDLDDDDEIFDDDFGRKSSDDIYAETYNGIIPNPLLDAMDPDGVYERLGPELFKDWTFWRDMILFAAFLTLFTRDTHHYGTFDSVVEGLERLPANFIRQS